MLLTTRAMPRMLLDLFPLCRMSMSPRAVPNTSGASDGSRFLFLPDVDSRIVRTRREDRSERWMTPCDLPDGSSVPEIYGLSARRKSIPDASYPFKTTPSPLAFPSTTLNTLTVRSDEQVANRFP